MSSFTSHYSRQPPPQTSIPLETAFEAIPEELRSERRWVLWGYEKRNGKLTKVPHTPWGRPAGSTNPSDWCSFDEALKAFQRGGFDRLGFVLGDGWAGIDLDSCLTSEIPSEVQGIVKLVVGYTEISPSGSGLHIIARGKFPPGPRRFSVSWASSAEVYDNGRFFTITGKILQQGNLKDDRSAALAELYAQLDFESFKSHAEAKGRALAEGDISGYPSPSEADLALCHHLLRYAGGDRARAERVFRMSGLYRPKWDERHSADGRTYGQMTLQKAAQGLNGAGSTRDADPSNRCPLTDLGNAERMASLFGDSLRYVPAWDWLIWDRQRWKRDETKEIHRLAIQTVRSIYREAAGCEDTEDRKRLADWAKRSESR
jgi:putative DNA primase/helicase